MDLIGEMVHAPLAAANASPAALYRALEDRKPTLLLDEVDAFLAQKSESSEAVRGILNSGHRRGRYSTVIRSNEKGELQLFDVFGPKVLSGIGKVHATLRDRSITLTLRRKRPDERVERLRIARMDEEFEEIRELCIQTADEIRDRIALADPAIPETLSDRAADNWELLLAIADEAGSKWGLKAREAAVGLSDSEGDDSHRVTLLSDIRDYFEETGHAVAPTNDLLAHLNDLETRPWCTWHRDNPMTARDLAKQLSPFGIEPKQRKLNGLKLRGSHLEDMSDAFSRYLHTSENAGTPVPDDTNSLQGNELSGYRHETGYRYNPVPEQEGTTPYRYPENIRYRDNSLQDNDLAPKGTGVPDNPGVSVGERLAAKGYARPVQSVHAGGDA
jgi:putative DNA primase/helicase